MRVRLVGLAVALTLASGAAAADRNATATIVAGDYVTAEQRLAAERRIFPNRPELMLNLAAVYRQTGRDADARALYADVLAREDVSMTMLDRRILSSHVIAESQLARLTQVAAR